jgi:hypothetical protein
MSVHGSPVSVAMEEKNQQLAYKFVAAIYSAKAVDGVC